MARGGPSGEVVPAEVDLLDEGNLGVDEATRSQDTVHLGNDSLRVNHVLEYPLTDHRVDRPVGEGDVMAIADHRDAGAGYDIGGDEVDPGVGFQSRHFRGIAPAPMTRTRAGSCSEASRTSIIRATLTSQ